MQQFDLSIWLQDESRKVVTRDGRPVRIVCYDKLGDYPIIGCIKYSDDYEDLATYNIDGSKYYPNREDPHDLFFADEEEELTEFDYAVLSIISDHRTHTDSITDFAKRSSKKLLDLARKEILKDLPKWKKDNNKLSAGVYTVENRGNGNIILSIKDWCVNILELIDRLPKEE